MADGVQWIKLKVGMFDGNSFKKIKRAKIGGESFRDKLTAVWVELMDFAGKCNCSGALVDDREIPYRDFEDIAAMLDREKSEIELCMNYFVNEGMVEIVDDVYMLSNWTKYQNEGRLAEIRESERIRKADYRNRQKLALGSGACPDVSGTCPGQVPEMSRDPLYKNKTIDYRLQTTEVEVLPESTQQNNHPEDNLNLSTVDGAAFNNTATGNRSVASEKPAAGGSGGRRRTRSEVVRDMYNEICAVDTDEFPALPACVIVSQEMKRTIADAIKAGMTSERFRAYFEKVRRNPVMHGKNELGWMATFGWLIDPEHMADVLNGKYDQPFDRGNGQTPGPAMPPAGMSGIGQPGDYEREAVAKRLGRRSEKPHGEE